MDYTVQNQEQQVNIPSLPKALTVRQFHEAIGGIIGINTLYAYARSGRLRTVRVGTRKLLILRSEVEEFFTREADKN